MDLSLSPTGKRYFAIAADDSSVHAISGAQNAHLPGTSTSRTLSHIAVDYFDTTGKRYELHTAGGSPTLTPTGDPADPAKVHERLTKVLQNLRNTVDSRAGGPGQPTVENALATLPNLTGRTLDQCFELLVDNFGHDQGMTNSSGSFWHNFWCH